jgi:transposase
MEELKYDVRKLSPKEQEEVRKKIVREMKKRGCSKEVAEICECTVRHVNKTWKKYQEGGLKAISAVKMGSPIGIYGKLSPKQEEEIKQEISDKNPLESGLSGYLWGRKEVSELVKKKYSIDIAVTTMGDYLRKWNFTPQRPKKKITAKTPKKYNSSTHRGLLAKEWKEKNTESIRIFNLPSYAPHLNPVEYLNNNLKQVLVKMGYSKSEDEIEKKAMSIMRSIQSTKNRVESFFDNEHVKYAKSQE